MTCKAMHFPAHSTKPYDTEHSSLGRRDANAKTNDAPCLLLRWKVHRHALHEACPWTCETCHHQVAQVG